MIEHKRIAYTVEEALKLLDICRAIFYQEMNAGRLTTFLIPQRRRRVSARAIDRWIEQSERASNPATQTIKRAGRRTVYRERNTARGAK